MPQKVSTPIPISMSETHHFDLITLQNNLTDDDSSTLPMCYVLNDPCYMETEVEAFTLTVDLPKGTNEILSPDLIPMTLVAPRTIQKQPASRVLKALCDSGGTVTLIHKKALPKGATPIVGSNKKFITLAGAFTSTRTVYLRDIVLPEFSGAAQIDGHACYVFSWQL